MPVHRVLWTEGFTHVAILESPQEGRRQNKAAGVQYQHHWQSQYLQCAQGTAQPACFLQLSTYCLDYRYFIEHLNGPEEDRTEVEILPSSLTCCSITERALKHVPLYCRWHLQRKELFRNQKLIFPFNSLL